MDRSDLELVQAIRQHGSMTAAARALRLAPSVVTKRLAALEDALGTRLFQRTTRHVSATPEGETLCLRAATLLQGFKDAEDELRERQSEPAGLIRLAATFGFGRRWVGPAVAAFQQLHPKLQVQLQLTEALPDLAKEGLDGAVWLWNAPEHRTAEWMSRRLARNQRVLVATPRYLAHHGTPTTPEDLSRHACLIVRENSTDPDQRFDSWLLKTPSGKRVRVPVQGPLSSNSGEMVRDWCLAGQGIMLRSLWDVAPLLSSGALLPVLPGHTMPDADVHWLAPFRSQVPRRIRLLLEHLHQSFSGEPWRQAQVNASGLAPAPPGSPPGP